MGRKQIESHPLKIENKKCKIRFFYPLHEMLGYNFSNRIRHRLHRQTVRRGIARER